MTPEIISTCCGAPANEMDLCSECYEHAAMVELESYIEWLDGSESAIDRGLIVCSFAATA